ncbi:MAG: hypothetical protein HQL64_08145 [Magnetococcales bacterium]|nr:hypothetical protein [Magnetococcales bacterium]
MITARKNMGNKRVRMADKPSLLSNQRVEKRQRSRPRMKSTSERIFIQLPKLPSFRRSEERSSVRSLSVSARSLSAPVSATIRRAGSQTVHGATSVFSATVGITMTLLMTLARALRWGAITLWRTLQWSFFAARQTLQWLFHFLRLSWQWGTFLLVTSALLLKQGIGFLLEWIQIGIEWCLYLLSEMMTLLKKGVWHLMEATKQIAWFVTDVIQQSFFFVADIVQQVVWTLSDWIRGAFTFSTPEPVAETEYHDDMDQKALESVNLGTGRVEPELELEQPLFAKGKKEWEDTHFESAKMNSLDNEEQAIPREALEDQAGALRMRLSTDPYHP